MGPQSPFARACAAAVMCCVAASAGAQTVPPRPLDLRAAIAYAIAHNPQIATERAAVAADESAFARAHAAEYPAIAGTLQNVMQRSENTAGSYGQIGLTPQPIFSQNTAQIGASWNIFTGAAAQINAQSAKRALEAERSALHRQEQQLAGDVATAFYGLIARHNVADLAASDLAYQRTLVDVANALERVGRTAAVDSLRARVNALRSEATLTSAQADVQNATESLAQRIGAPPDTTFALPATVPQPALPAQPMDVLIAAARDSRSDVLRARAELAHARLADAGIDTDRLPQIQVTAAFGNQYSPTTGSVVPGGGNPGFWQIGASETITLPLIEYGTRRAAHAAAQAKIDAAEAALTSAENAVAVEIRQAFRAAQTASTNLQTSQEADTLGRESARIARLQYAHGLISLTDATAAEQSALQAATDLVGARVAYAAAIVNLDVAIGAGDATTLAAAVAS